MLCQNCGRNEANVRYTQIINGNKKEGMVCAMCAKKMGLGDFEINIPMHFSNFLGDFFDDYETNLLPNFVKENQICNSCGEIYDDFVKTGLLGCPNCYDEFDTRLNPILKRLQGSVKHIGRGLENNNDEIKGNNQKDARTKIRNTNNAENNENISKNDEKNDMEEKRNKLEEDLKQAIKEERYEDAAKIRDEIKKCSNS